jgi:O-antigen ligase
MSATLFWTMDLPMSSSMLATALQLFALYIVVSMFPIDLAQLRFARRMVIAGGVLAASYGIYLFHSGAGVRGDRLWISVDSGTLDPNHFAAALLLPIAFALSAFLWAPSRRVKIVALAGTFIMFMALTLSGSRGAMLGLIAIAIYLLIRDTHRVRLAIVMGCVGAVVIATSGASLISRFQIALSSGGAGRTDIWRIGAAAFKDHWLLGAGYGDFQFAYDSAFLRVFEPAYTNWHRAPHNTLLGAAVELGLIGAILLLCAWIGQFRMLAAIPSADERFPARIALEGALIGLFVSGMFADLMIEKYVWLAFMMVALTYNATTSQRDIHA